MDGGLVVYGTAWCADVARSRALLDELNIDYRYIDVEQDDRANAWCAGLNNGVRKVPTIAFPRGLVLIEPTNEELLAALCEERQIKQVPLHRPLAEKTQSG